MTMNKKHLGFIVLLVLALAISLFYNSRSTDLKSRIYLPPASVSVRPDMGTAVASGAWIPQEYSSYTFFLPKDITTTDIFCDKSAGVCNETRAVLAYSDNMAGSQKYSLFTHTFEYQIKEWTNEYLKATLDGGGRVFDLTMNFTNKSATLVVSDSQSNPTASPGTQTAILGK